MVGYKLTTSPCDQLKTIAQVHSFYIYSQPIADQNKPVYIKVRPNKN